jgi:hypothetical protein
MCEVMLYGRWREDVVSVGMSLGYRKVVGVRWCVCAFLFFFFFRDLAGKLSG